MAITIEQQEEVCTILANLFQENPNGCVLWEEIYERIRTTASFKIENWIDVRNCVCAFQQIGVISHDRKNVFQETYHVL